MNPQTACKDDFKAWIDLAREVEHLFGPMADVPSFKDALVRAIEGNNAFCIRNEQAGALVGGIVISRETNEIVWLVVSEQSRGEGYGRALLEFALTHLNSLDHVLVQTFDETVPAGYPARRLYQRLGFEDYQKADVNPAGIPTVIMRRNGNRQPSRQPLPDMRKDG